MKTAGLFTTMTAWAKPSPPRRVTDYQLVHPWIPIVRGIWLIFAWSWYLMVAMLALCIMIYVWMAQAIIWTVKQGVRYAQQRTAVDHA